MEAPMSIRNEILSKLHKGIDPYTNFPSSQWSGAWYNDAGACRDILKRTLERTSGGIIVEVGSFVGESAIFMANCLKSMNRDAVVICIDTWCAGIDHYKGAPEKIRNHFGRPDLYYRFLSNVIQHGCHDVILPLAFDSLNGARLLKLLNIQPDFIYVDASHEEGDAGRDYEAYWDVLKPGGFMIVDDITGWFPGCVRDWEAFLARHKLTVIDAVGEKHVVQK